MIKTLKSREKNFEKILNSFLKLRRGYSSKKITVVKKIINDVEMHGDKSVIKYEKKFNNLKTLKSNNLTFTKSEIKKSIKFLDRKVKNSIDLAFSRISTIRVKSLINLKKDKINNSFYYRSKPVEKVGVYVPGGKASYPSSVLMNCIPASIAGVMKFLYCTFFRRRNKSRGFVCSKEMWCKKNLQTWWSTSYCSFCFWNQSCTES